MDQQTLLKFIRQIITLNQNAPYLALNELERILEKQGVSPDLLELVRKAQQGISDSSSVMRETVNSLPALSPEALLTAVTRAHEKKLRDEEAARNGRC